MIDMRNAPDFLTTENLVDLGVFHSTSAAYYSRRKKHGIDFIKIRSSVLYTKKAVISYLDRNNIEYLLEDEYEF